MLAYSQGGASTPGGATAVMGNKGLAAATAAQAAAQTQSQIVTNEKTRAETANIHADTELKGGQLVQTLSSAGQLDALRDNIRQEMQAFEDRWQKLKWEVRSSELESDIKHAHQYEASSRMNTTVRRTDAEVKAMEAEATKLQTQAKLLGLEVPESISRASFWKSPAGAAKPYTEHGGQILRDATSATKFDRLLNHK